MKEKIRADLDKLHAEIQSLDDSASRAVLNDLVRDIEQQLAGPETSVGEISGEIEDAVTRFEVTHPTTAAILQSILNTLASIGI